MDDFVIEVQNEAMAPEAWEALLATAVRATLQQQHVSAPAEVTLLLSDDRQLRQLNRDFRQVDAPTDVLSFPGGEAMPGLPMPYLGDIAISLPTATRQAEQAGHSVVAELQLLAVHGTLHLLGHDHGEPEEKAAMWAAQQAVLDQLGLSHVTPTET